MRRILPWLLLASCAPRTGTGALGKVDSHVTFDNHRFDLAPFLTSYPYSPTLPIWQEGGLLVDVQGATRSLTRVKVDFDGQAPQPPIGDALNDVDWDSRNRWNMMYNPVNKHVYWMGDANNNERINLWRMPSAGGRPERLTDEAYHYGYAWSPDHSQIALIPRRGEAPFNACLEIVDAATLARTPIVCDTPQVKFTWSRPSWSPSGNKLILRVNLQGKRDHGNLALVDLKTKQLDLLLDPTPVRSSAYALSHWLDDNTPMIVTDDGGSSRLRRYAIDTARFDLVYDAADEALSDVTLLKPDGTPRVVVTSHTPVADELHLLDPRSGDELATHTISGSVRWIGDDDTSRALLTATSASSPFQTYRVDVAVDALAVRPWLGLPEKDVERTVRCDVKAVQFPTWDQVDDTGEPRMLHGFLYTPKRQVERAQQLVRVTAFYGGSNTFSKETQIHCEAGIATFSPAVRGSWGFGPAFSQMNNGDLGGDEIVDLFYAARWLASQGFSPSKIGLHGGSHGGYATMRALTFPAGTNGHAAEQIFPFAFGVSRAGFSDIVTFHDTCNIPDWVLLEAGDPTTEADKLHDRSPLTHADLLKAPLLMVHGENDSRVPVAESRQMAEACTTHDAPCTYLEFEGMGHHIKGVGNMQRMYQAVFDVLGTVD